MEVMDLSNLYIGLGVFCVSALVMYLITKFATRETSYDEVIALQKMEQEKEREMIKNNRKREKEQMKKKYRKGKGDKSKEKSAQVSEPDFTDSPKSQQKEHKMVNLELEPEIIEPSDNRKHKNRTAARKRSILHNKNEVAPVAETAVEIHHKDIKPLDDLELKKLHDTKTCEVFAPNGTSKELEEEVKEVKLEKVEAAEVQLKEPVREEKVTKTKGSTVGTGISVKGPHLIETVRTAKLSDHEMQTLVDVLLHRQGITLDSQDSWTKKGRKDDPAVIKKQLEEKENALQEEQQRASSCANRVKELRTELRAEREKVSALEKSLQTDLKREKEEKEALKVRLSDMGKKHVSEVSELKEQLKLECEKSSEAATKLKQENKILQEALSKAAAENASSGDVAGLKQKVAIMEKELSNNAVRINASENAKKSSEEKLKKYEEQIKQLESYKNSVEDTLKKKEEEMNKEIRKADTENNRLSSDLNSAKADCASLKTKLKELEKHLSSHDASKELEAKLQESERKGQELEGKVKDVEKQLVEAVHAQKDTGAKLQASESKKQELEGNLKNLEKQLSDAVRHQDETNTQLQKLQQETSALSQALKTAQEKQQTQAATNGTSEDVSGNDSKNVMKIEEHERIVSEKMAMLTKVQAELEAQTKKNNELRQKNWKAMEALKNTEKLAAEQFDKGLKSSREELDKTVSETEKNNKEVLMRLFPAVKVGDKLGHKEWLASFEKQAALLLEQSSGSEKNMSEKVSHLEEENSRLQADVEVFKNNIAILHSEKDRIHELEEENKKLQHQSETYEKNFMQLNAEQEKLLHIEEENQRLKHSLSTNASSSEEILRLQKENQDLQSRLSEKEDSIAEVEKKLHNLERVVETEEKKWKEKVQQAEEALSRGSESSGREQELEDLTIQQQTQIEHYRTVLTNTENVLRQLESAEKSWEEKLQASQADLEKSRSECQKAHEELHALRGSTEMKCKMETLEDELRQSTEKVNVLTKEKDELVGKVIVLETQTKAVIQVDHEDLRKQLEEVRHDLEGERKRNKELSSTLVRLNGIIKTGQDALSQEQKVVQQLQEQLTDKAKGSGSSASQEIEQGTSTATDTGTSV